MIIALFALVLVAGIGTLLFTRTINEMRHSKDDAAIVQTLLLARGGSNVGGALLGNDIKGMLKDAVRATASPGPWILGSGDGDTPTASSVITKLNGIVALLQPEVDALLCDEVITPADSTAEIRLRIYFTATPANCRTALPTDVRLPSPRYVSGPRRNADVGVQTYALPFVMISEATVGEYRRNIVTQGEYRFEVGQANFSMYAYFTNREVSSGFGKIWFTDKTMIDGPTHTNGHFAFAYDPWFGGRVSSAGCNDASCTSIDRGAYLYRYTHTQTSNCRWETEVTYVRDNNGDYVRVRPGEYRLWRRGDGRWVRRYRREEQQVWTCDTTTTDLVPDTALGTSPDMGGNAPVFADGVAWDSTPVPLPTNNYEQRDIAQGVDRSDEGLYFNSDLYSLDFFAGTDAVWNGNPSSVAPTLVNGVWTPPSTYQYVRACTTQYPSSCQVSRIDATGVVELFDGTSWAPRPSGRTFNGVIYVNGDVDRFKGPSRTQANDPQSSAPALASFSQITLASDHDIRITGDLKYELPPCTGVPTRNDNRTVNKAECDNLGALNVLGLYTASGNILVGHRNSPSSLNAPDDVQVHAVLMSAKNEIKVENYNTGDSGGFFLLGGMIQERRGIFGTFSGSGQDATRTGYERVYTYDPRMQEGLAPPFFPATNVDDVTNVTFFTFGQREQLYD